MRVAGGWGLGLFLLLLGEWATRRRMPWFAASVTGAGLGMGYIASYAASPQFWNLLDLTASYAAFCVVTALGLLQAVRLGQLTTAIFALLGGYLTLALLRTAHPTAAGLLGYLIALDLGASARASCGAGRSSATLPGRAAR